MSCDACVSYYAFGFLEISSVGAEVFQTLLYSI